MTYIKNAMELKIGDRVRLTQDIEVMDGKMKAGTIVTMFEESGYKGYSFKDDEGNIVTECGFGGWERL